MSEIQGANSESVKGLGKEILVGTAARLNLGQEVVELTIVKATA